MEWGDVLTIVLVLSAVWYILVPKQVRAAASAGFGPAVHAAAENVRGIVRAVAPAVHWLAYDVLLGVKRDEDVGGVRMSSTEAAPLFSQPVAPRLATTATEEQQSVATLQNDSNELLLRAKAEALAALVLAGKVGETEGIKRVYGVAPSSSNPRYLAARDALKAAMAEQSGASREAERDKRLEEIAQKVAQRA